MLCKRGGVCLYVVALCCLLDIDGSGTKATASGPTEGGAVTTQRPLSTTGGALLTTQKSSLTTQAAFLALTGRVSRVKDCYAIISDQGGTVDMVRCATLEPAGSVHVKGTSHLTALSPESIIASQKDERSISEIGADGRVRRSFTQYDRDLYCEGLRGNASGSHAAVWLVEDTSLTGNFNAPRLKIGLIEGTSGQCTWLAELHADTPSGTHIEEAIVSDDGMHVAVGGWKHGVAYIDAKERKVLWERRPKGATGLETVAFAPGNEFIYAGDFADGIVFRCRITGDNPDEKFEEVCKVEQWHKITSLAVSPDGKLLAVGTGPSGDVFVFSTKNGQMVETAESVDKATVYGLCWSPDSGTIVMSDAKERLSIHTCKR